MSDYTKTTDFTAKDALSPGDPNKIVSGAGLDTEFDAIAVAVATKANKASPTFTGTATFASLKGATGATVTAILDEDTMSSDSATALATQQSIKAYVDTQVAAQDTLSEVLATGNSTGGTDIVVTAGDSITTDTITETTAASGVTIDGVLVKDTAISFDSGSNYLDDYEEGTFTFGVEDTSSNALSLSNTTGYYTKVGRLVHFSLFIDVTSLGSASTNACRVTGLPFTVGSAANSIEFGAGYCGRASKLAITAGQSVSGYLVESTTNMNLYLWDSNEGNSGLTANEISADGELQMSGTYWTSA